jgi:hypothetical protein
MDTRYGRGQRVIFAELMFSSSELAYEERINLSANEQLTTTAVMDPFDSFQRERPKICYALRTKEEE